MSGHRPGGGDRGGRREDGGTGGSGRDGREGVGTGAGGGGPAGGSRRRAGPGVPGPDKGGHDGLGGAGRVARLVCGRRTKWLVVALWLVVLVAAAPAAQKLADAQNNDQAAWLPAGAESTKVIELSEKFRPDTAPAVVVYARPSGLTPQDRERIAADAAELRGLTAHGIIGDRVQGPLFDRRQDPRAAEILVPVGIGDEGWNRLADAVGSIRDVTGGGSGGLETRITGPGGIAADSAKAFEGIDGTLLYAALSVVIVILL